MSRIVGVGVGDDFDVGEFAGRHGRRRDSGGGGGGEEDRCVSCMVSMTRGQRDTETGRRRRQAEACTPNLRAGRPRYCLGDADDVLREVGGGPFFGVGAEVGGWAGRLPFWAGSGEGDTCRVVKGD